MKTKKPPAPPRGQPTIRTPEIKTILVSAFGSGFTTNEACEAAGISVRAFMAWKASDKTFLSELKKSRQQRRLALLNRIRIAANDPKYWTAAARLLELEFPEHYGPRASFGSEDTNPLQRALDRLNREEQEREKRGLGGQEIEKISDPPDA